MLRDLLVTFIVSGAAALIAPVNGTRIGRAGRWVRGAAVAVMAVCAIAIVSVAVNHPDLLFSPP